MILDIYKDALEYSAKDWKTLVILGILCLFSFLMIPVFLVTGYNYKVLHQAVHGVINGNDPLPNFEGIIEMFVDGIKVVIVEIVYLIVPIILFMIFLLVSGYLSGTASAAVLFIGCAITFVVGVVACLMTQMGLCHMAYNDGAFSKAFALSEIKEAIDEIGWFKCIATYLGLIIITIVISIVVIAIIGLIFAVFGFSGLVFGSSMVGGIFAIGIIVNALVSMFIVGPYLSIFNSRSIGLLYTMQI